jgi:hypothetical protein
MSPQAGASRGLGIKLESSVSQEQPTDERVRLEAIRDRLELALNDPETATRDLASVARELRHTLAALSQIAPTAAGTKLDEIAARRRKRGA